MADVARTRLVAIIQDVSGAVVGGLRLTLNQPSHEDLLRFARCLIKAFADDLRSAPEEKRDGELWLSLQQTRHSRAIGKYSPFHTEYFVKWLRTFEAAESLRYEGTAFSAQLLLTKQLNWVRDNAALSYVPFPRPLSVSAALFEEKWVRALAANGDVTLVGYGHDRGISGMFSVEGPIAEPANLIAPHYSLSGLCSALVPGTMAFVTAPTGDLHLLLPDGSSFVKSQGYWRFSSSQALKATLATLVEPFVETQLLRTIFDLSYEAKGALFCIPDAPQSIAQLVPDFSSPTRSNGTLRATSQKLSLAQPGHGTMIKNIATIDGAVILNRHGTLLDAACMIGDPSPEALAQIGLTSPLRFPGARSTAAWNASVRGTAIKVSEDGPISVFRHGHLLLQIG